MKVPIVNETDEVIAYKERSEIDFDHDIFRSAALWVTNSNGEVLLAQRKFNKKVNPGKWGEAVGGIVEGDDSYLETIIHEASEELGLENLTIEKGPKQLISASAKYFIQWYTICLDKSIDEFTIQTEEVEQIALVSMEELRKDLAINPDKYVDKFSEIVDLVAG